MALEKDCCRRKKVSPSQFIPYDQWSINLEVFGLSSARPDFDVSSEKKPKEKTIETSANTSLFLILNKEIIRFSLKISDRLS
jgi:hypothetical protein